MMRIILQGATIVTMEYISEAGKGRVDIQREQEIAQREEKAEAN